MFWQRVHRGDGMIELTDLNGVPFYLNSNLIESVRKIPETKVALSTGNYYLVKESPDDIIQKIIEYNRKIFSNLIRTDID